MSRLYICKMCRCRFLGVPRRPYSSALRTFARLSILHLCVPVLLFVVFVVLIFIKIVIRAFKPIIILITREFPDLRVLEAKLTGPTDQIRDHDFSTRDKHLARLRHKYREHIPGDSISDAPFINTADPRHKVIIPALFEPRERLVIEAGGGGFGHRLRAFGALEHDLRDGGLELLGRDGRGSLREVRDGLFRVAQDFGDVRRRVHAQGLEREAPPVEERYAVRETLGARRVVEHAGQGVEDLFCEE